MFTIKVSVEGHGTAEATAQSKRQAQKDAAKALLAKL
jgi:dsRNA-specific ribonuclease